VVPIYGELLEMFYLMIVYRFFKQQLLIFLIQQMVAGIFHSTVALCRTMIIVNTGRSLSLLLMFMLGGFILSKG